MSGQRVPQWVEDRMRADALMGPLEDSPAEKAAVVGGVFIGIAINVIFWIVVAVVLYAVGKAVVG